MCECKKPKLDGQKALNVTNMDELKQKCNDVEIFGDPGRWVCICKASSEKQGWMKSTKVMDVNGGCLVQVTSEFRDGYGCVTSCAEALTFVPGVSIALYKQE